MKRILVLILMTACLVAAGCEAQPKNGDKLRVVATIFPAYDFVRQIAGGRADAYMLVKPGMEDHGYEPTPLDIERIRQADVFAYIGGENESWVERILDSMDLGQKKLVRLIDSVQTLEEEDHHEIDEHIWTSPKNAILMAEALGAALIEADPEEADAFEGNLNAYVDRLSALDAEFEAVVKGGARTELVFGDRYPFRYLADAYGLTAYAAFPSCANETEPSAHTIASLIDRVRQGAIPVVYQIEQSNGRVAAAIAEATGAKVLTLHSCHNVTKTELESGATYLSLMQKNVQTLREGLS